MRTPKGKETTVEMTILAEATVEAVWKALTDPELIKLYANATAESDWQRGRPIRWYAMKDGQRVLKAKGMIMANLPSRRLRYTTYQPASGLPDEPASHTTVDIALEAMADGRTRVSLWQGDFAGLPHAEKMARDAGKAWVETLVGLGRVAGEEGAANKD